MCYTFYNSIPCHTGAETGGPTMNDKLIRQITSEIAEALVSRKLAAIPNRKAAQALLKSCGMAEFEPHADHRCQKR